MPEIPRIKYEYAGNGSTSLYPVLWPYIDRNYVRVSLRRKGQDEKPQDITSSIRWISEHEIEVLPPPAQGETLYITRQTPSHRPLMVFRDGSTQLAADLNLVSEQLIHIIEESRDYTTEVHDYVGKAEGYLEQLGGLTQALEDAEDAVTRSNEAADRSEGSAQKAADTVKELTGLSTVGQSVPHDHSAAVFYDSSKSLLTVFIPEGRPGERGVQGPQGERGEDGKTGPEGKQGPEGKEGKQGPPGAPPRVDMIDCGFARTTHLIKVDAGNARYPDITEE